MLRANDEVWKNAVSSHSVLIPFETVYEERGGLLRSIARRKNLVSLRQAAFVPFFYVLWFKLKNFTIEPFDMKKKIKKNQVYCFQRNGLWTTQQSFLSAFNQAGDARGARESEKKLGTGQDLKYRPLSFFSRNTQPDI